MNQLTLKKHLISLASLPENDSPVLSVYFDLNFPLRENRARLEMWAKLARSSFEETQRVDFDKALDNVLAALENIGPGKSAAVFSRSGANPLIVPMTFNVPIEEQFHARGVPVIFPLVEMRDRFQRFVLVAMNRDSARIFEISLGKVSQQLLAESPDLRKRLGREWTREHYQNHRRNRSRIFVKEKISIIEQLMAKSGHNALILAGESRFVLRLREQLPGHLRDKIAGEIRSGVCEGTLSKVVEQSVNVFLQQENKESHDAVSQLDSAVRSGGLAVVGLEQTLRAIELHQADQLILSADLPTAERERLVRLATLQELPVETVRNSVTLECNGGVGCLLRYLPKFDPQAALAAG